MGFNAASFEYIGGGAGGALWRYFTADNVASMALGTATAAYWDTNILDNFPGFERGDIVMAINGATPTVTFFVCSAAEKVYSNGVSMVPCGNSMGGLPAGQTF